MTTRDALTGGLLAFPGVFMLWQARGFPSCPVPPHGAALLPRVLGGMLERAFATSLIRPGGDPAAFFHRPVAAVGGLDTLVL